jgi:hypothetical protein
MQGFDALEQWLAQKEKQINSGFTVDLKVYIHKILTTN